MGWLTWFFLSIDCNIMLARITRVKCLRLLKLLRFQKVYEVSVSSVSCQVHKPSYSLRDCRHTTKSAPWRSGAHWFSKPASAIYLDANSFYQLLSNFCMRSHMIVSRWFPKQTITFYSDPQKRVFNLLLLIQPVGRWCDCWARSWVRHQKVDLCCKQAGGKIQNPHTNR